MLRLEERELLGRELFKDTGWRAEPALPLHVRSFGMAETREEWLYIVGGFRCERMTRAR